MDSRRTSAALTISPLVAAVRQGLQLKGNSLLMTLFGDALGPRHQAVWLGTLIELAGQLGLSSRLVRTSVYRLVADDWLVVNRVGRCSYYSLSPGGLRRAQHARSRIHAHDAVQADAMAWTLLMVSDQLKASTRLQLQRELRWNGYGQVADRVYARTGADKACLHDILRANGAGDQVCVMQAHHDAAFTKWPMHALQGACCCEHRLARAWQGFVLRFTPVLTAPTPLSEHEAFLVRTLLIHEFRRILQRQPNLAHAMQPNEPTPANARALFTQLYSQLKPPSERWLDQQLAGAQGVRAELVLPTSAPTGPTLRAAQIQRRGLRTTPA